MQTKIQEWFACASQVSVVKRACGYALVVGPILIFINHGDELIAGHVSTTAMFQMGLTMLVPYLVSTFSSVGAMRS